MGGRVAMTMALLGTQRLSQLVVVDIAPVTYPDMFRPLIQAVLDLDLASLEGHEDADRQLALPLSSPEARAMLLHNLVRRDGAWAWRIHWTAIAEQLETLLAFPVIAGRDHSDVPALFMCGGRSDFVRAEHHTPIRTLFPRVCVQVVEEAGHWVQADRPTELAQAVQAWAI
jgi:esterase